MIDIKQKNEIVYQAFILNESIQWWHREIEAVMAKITEIEQMPFSLEKESLDEEYQGRLRYLLGKANFERINIENLQKFSKEIH